MSVAKRILFDYIILLFNPFVAATASAVFINCSLRYRARQCIRHSSAERSVTTEGYVRARGWGCMWRFNHGVGRLTAL